MRSPSVTFQSCGDSRAAFPVLRFRGTICGRQHYRHPAQGDGRNSNVSQAISRPERKWEESVPERTEFWRRKEDNPWILLAI